MPEVSNVDALFFELSTLTQWDRAKWETFCTLSPELQAATLQNYRECDWLCPTSPSFARVIAILETLGTIAGVVAGVASAAIAVNALRAL